MLPPHAVWRDDLYFRRKVPNSLSALSNCGDFYKVPLSTKDARVAEPLTAAVLNQR